MSKPVVFISYSRKDEAWKDRVITHLGVSQQQNKLELWHDGLIDGGDDWCEAIMRAIDSGSIAILLVSANSLTSDFILHEEVPRLLQLRKEGRVRFFPILVSSVDLDAVGWLKRMNLRPKGARALDLRSEGEINAELADIAKKIRTLSDKLNASASSAQPTSGEPPAMQPPVERQIRPYRGLEAFREEDEQFFFGRDSFAEQLLAKVTADKLPLVAVVGSSGSGKSSIVRAGLLPGLRLETSPVWDAAIFTPGESPFRNLAEALALVEDKRLDSWQRRVKANERGEYLASGKLTIKDAVAITLEAADGTDKLLLVLDQFEELFTLTPEADRRPFIESLLAAIRTAPVTLLLTLRADFYSQAINLTRELSGLIQQGIVNLGPLLSSELRAVIETPARLVDLQFESGLVSRILRDVQSQPDSLALLEYGLTELWKSGQGNLITHVQYEEISGVEGAISRRADDVLASFPDDQQEAALKALTRLVRVSIEDDEGVDTRRRAKLSELNERSRQILQKFVDARLLVTSRNEVTGEETIEVAHEALIRRWGRLRESLDKDREFLLWKRRLGFRMREWETANRDEGALLQGALMVEAKQWLAERKSDLTPEERSFIIWAERDEHRIEQVLSKGSSASTELS